DLLLALREGVQGRPEGRPELGQGQFGVVDTEQVAQLGAVDPATDQGLQRNGRVGAGAFQPLDDVLLRPLQVPGDVGDGRGPAHLLGQGRGGFVDVELELLQPPGYPDVPGTVPEVPLDLADDGGYGVGGEVVAVLRVEPVDGLDQADNGDLGQVVKGF